MKTLTKLIVTAVALTLSPAAFAGGYHCMLKVKDLKIHADNKYELTVEKVQADRALYQKQLANWPMVAEETGKPFRIIFKIEKMDAKALECLNTVIQGLRLAKPVEFGFGDTAMKVGADGAYHSTGMGWFHKDKNGNICVHGS